MHGSFGVLAAMGVAIAQHDPGACFFPVRGHGLLGHTLVLCVRVCFISSIFCVMYLFSALCYAQ